MMIILMGHDDAHNRNNLSHNDDDNDHGYDYDDPSI